MKLDDTIAAIASAPGGAARGIVRVSGAATIDCLRRFTSSRGLSPLDVREPTAIEGHVQLDGFVSPLPCTLFLWPTSRSYTREPVAEFHTIGSPPLLQALLRTVCSAGARLAEPGEFTLRAFLAGRLDLTQAEAVLGVIDSADRSSLQTALRQLAGGLSGPLGTLREELLNLLADLEAGLDFADEHIEFIDAAQLQERLQRAAEIVRGIADQLQQRGEAQELVRIALVGAPNAGKSSLFNALVAGHTAIVDDTAGTTRDYLKAPLDLDGVHCELIDTAGIELATPDTIAGAAQRLSAEQHRQAQIRVLCLDAAAGGPRPLEMPAGEPEHQPPDLVVLTKIDGAGMTPPPAVICTSSVTGQGLSDLRSRLRQLVVMSSGPDGGVTGTAIRCTESLRLAEAALAQANSLAVQGGGEELIAAEIRASLTELGKVVGAVYTDDVLDRIFSRFCIGK